MDRTWVCGICDFSLDLGDDAAIPFTALRGKYPLSGHILHCICNVRAMICP